MLNNYHWRTVLCALANVVLRMFNRRLEWVAFPRHRFAWNYPDRETQFVTGPLLGVDGQVVHAKTPSNPRKYKLLPFVFLLMAAPVEAQQPTQRPRVAVDRTIRATGSLEFLSKWHFVPTKDFEGSEVVLFEGDKRIAQCVLRDVFVDCSKTSKPIAGVTVRNVSATNLENVRVQRSQGPGIRIDSGWNVDVSNCQCMYCGQDGESPACVIDGSKALADDPARTPGGFWRQATNDVRIVGGRFEGSRVQLRLVDTTDIVVVGTKLHGDPQRRDEAGPLCELVSPRGPHVFRAMTLAHGAEPQFSVEWGDKQAHISIDAVDSDWPLNKPRDLVSELGNRPPGSDLEILKRVNAR